MSVLVLPDETTLRIFSYLSPFDVLSAGLTCTKWQPISKDDCLWRRFIQRRYPVDKAKTADHVRCCRQVPAIEAYRSIQEDVPRIGVQHVKLRDRSEILHISFSNNGRFVCSTSKNGRAHFWEVTTSYRLGRCQKLSQNDEVVENYYCFYSEFNEDDSLLLLCAGGIDRTNSCAVYVYDVTNLPSSVNLVESLTLSSDVYARWEDKTAFRFGEIQGEPGRARINIRRVEVTNDGLQLQGVDSSLYNILRGDFCGRLPSLGESKRYLQRQVSHISYSKVDDEFCPFQVGSCCIPNGGPYSSLQRESIRTRGRTIARVPSRSSGLRIFAANQFIEIEMTETFPIDERKATGVRTLEESLAYSHNQSVEIVMIKVTDTIALVPKTGCVSTFLDVNCKNYLARGNFSNSIQIRNRCSGALVATLEGHEGVVNALAFNPVNDHMLVSASDDGSLRVWHSKHLEKSELKKSPQSASRDKEIYSLKINKSRTCCII